MLVLVRWTAIRNMRRGESNKGLLYYLGHTSVSRKNRGNCIHTDKPRATIHFNNLKIINVRCALVIQDQLNITLQVLKVKI